MASLIRATNLWGYGDLIRELGADPEPFLSRFGIPPGVEYEEDAFVSFDAVAFACWRPAPRSWVVRTSGFASRIGRAWTSSDPSP